MKYRIVVTTLVIISVIVTVILTRPKNVETEQNQEQTVEQVNQ